MPIRRPQGELHASLGRVGSEDQVPPSSPRAEEVAPAHRLHDEGVDVGWDFETTRQRMRQAEAESRPRPRDPARLRERLALWRGAATRPGGAAAARPSGPVET